MFLPPASLAAALLALFLGPLAASTQPDDEAGTEPEGVVMLEPITVTAAKRETDPQRTPIAITVLAAADLERSGIEGSADLQFKAANFTYGVVNNDTHITVRGVGNENITAGGDPGVALHVDGVYFGRPSAAYLDYLDLERVEVLRGPQGTLYGRNTTGGSVNLITRQPTAELAASADLTLGDYDRINAVAGIGGPLAGDRVAGRISAAVDERDGYHRNVFDGSRLDDSDYWATRGQLRFTPGQSVDLVLSGYLHQEEGSGPVPKNLQDGIDDLRRSARDAPQRQDNEYDGLTATLTYIGRSYVLTSLSSYQELHTDFAFDSDGTRLPNQTVRTILDAEQLTQELRFASAAGERLEWIGGLYYFEEEAANDFDLADALFGPFLIDTRVDTESLAAFGGFSYRLGEKTRLRAGLRYNDDEKSGIDRQSLPIFNFATTFEQQDDWQEWSGDLGLDFELTDTSYLYAKLSRGYKSGGFNLPGDGIPYDPELVDAVEVGSKNRFAGNRLQLNATGFYYDYEDMQVFQVRNFRTLIENAAEATIGGVELELQARPRRGTLLSATLAWLDATYDRFVSTDPRRPMLGPQDLSGNRLNRAPEASFSLGVEHAFELGGRVGSLTPRLDFAWRDEVFFRQFNLPDESQDSFTRTDLRLVWDSVGGRWHAEAFVRNLENEDVIGNILVTQSDLSAYLYAPRTAGIRLAARF